MNSKKKIISKTKYFYEPSIFFFSKQISETNGELKHSECVPAKRDPEPRERLVGGVESFDKNHPDVTLFLNEALAEINVGEDPDYS